MELVIKKFADLCTEELYEILQIRNEIFVVEQNCPYQDLDGIDKRSFHVYLKGDKILAYLRIFSKDENTAQFGRLLVKKSERRKGYAAKILEKAIEISKKEMKKNEIYIEAEVYAISLFQKIGFSVSSEQFLEDGILLVPMIKKLENP